MTLFETLLIAIMILSFLLNGFLILSWIRKYGYKMFFDLVIPVVWSGFLISLAVECYNNLNLLHSSKEYMIWGAFGFAISGLIKMYSVNLQEKSKK